MGVSAPLRNRNAHRNFQLSCKQWMQHKRKLMDSYREALTNLLRDDSGQDLIEYALVAALIGLGAAAVMGSVGADVANIFTSIGSQLSSAT
jgi:pilus assembly protein Flp/PilA